MTGGGQIASSLTPTGHVGSTSTSGPAAAERIKAKSFTIDGEAVVLGPDGLSRFDELRRREAMRTAILYAFDLIERDGEDLRNRPFLDRKDALARLLLGTEIGILLNEQIADDGPTVIRARLPARCRGHRVQAGGRHLSIQAAPAAHQDVFTSIAEPIAADELVKALE